MSQLIIDAPILISSEDLNEIVANASFLWERLNSERFSIDDSDPTDSDVERRYQRWCQTVSHENDPEILQKRLQWDGLEWDSIWPRLGTVNLNPGQPLPLWADTLQAIMEVAATFNAEAEAQWPTNPNTPIPFEDVLLPALQVARERLLSALGHTQFCLDCPPLSMFSDEAYFSLERSLLRQLSGLCSKTFELEFSKSRSFGQNLITLLGVDEEVPPGTSNYQTFVHQILENGLLQFCKTYPVLGRFIATVVDFWVASTAEFIQRLAQDLDTIQHTFCPEINDDIEHHYDNINKQDCNSDPTPVLTRTPPQPSPCKGEGVSPLYKGGLRGVKPGFEQDTFSSARCENVIAIETALSDPHNRGQMVMLLTFEAGFKVVYKPKDLGLEVAWNQLISWCNCHSQLLDLKTMNVLQRGGYGWVEYVEHRPCVDTAAAKRCYQRAGMLLCLIYVLRGTDCHCENLIASGEHFVLIDMETLLHHDAHLIEDSPEAQTMAPESVQQFWDSVLRTGLLPRWDFSADNRMAYDVSGLSSALTQQSRQNVLGWQCINTDAMHRRYMPTDTLPAHGNVVFLGDTALSPHDYQADIAQGFEQIYRFLMDYHGQLLAPEGPLAAFQHQQARFIFRSTPIYSKLLINVLAPDHLQSGVDYSIELDQLSRAFVVSPEKPNAWPILQAELRATEQLDIPVFTASAHHNALELQGIQTIPQYFKTASYQQVIQQVQRLSESDLARQVAIIQGSFYARVAQTTSVESSAPEPEQDVPVLRPDQFIQLARDIAADLETRAIADTDGSLNWVGMGFISRSERFQLQMLKDGLYDGRCGVALFLAALGHVTQEAHFGDLALQVLHPLRQYIRTSSPDSQQRYARLTGIGAADGLGSMLYGLVMVSRLLGDQSVLDDAHQLADWITPDLITTDHQLDIIGGTAGAIIGLLSLHAATDPAQPLRTGQMAALETARVGGQHLLDKRVKDGDAPRAWKTMDDNILTGFSHGVTGIAYALLRLYAVTQNVDYLTAALDGIAYEQSLFCSEQSNWPDRRFEAGRDPIFAVQWCCGAAGIGLGRMGSLAIVDTPDVQADIQANIQADIEKALQTTQTHGVRLLDHLCCGNMGRVEALLVGGQRFSRPDWHQAALQQASHVVARAKQAGGYQLFANLPTSVFNPGFFQGMTGIGYQFLRLARPDLPSVLGWE